MSTSLKQCKANIVKELSKIYDRHEAESICTLLIEHFTGWGKADQVLNASLVLKKNILRAIYSALEELKKERPLQYVLGETEFYGLKLPVKEGVLIPRPETEELVDKIVKLYKGKSGLKILDIGTGSGAIAISLSKCLPDTKIFASDISETALKQAKQNALDLSANVTFIHHDIFSPLTEILPDDLDCIVSNPPYVRESEKQQMHPNVLRYEPELALFVTDDDPLIYYKRLAEISKTLLKPHGIIFCEINEALAVETKKCFEDCGFGNIFVYKDINNKNRILKTENI